MPRASDADRSEHRAGGSTARRSPAATRERLVQLLEPVVAATGYELDEVRVSPAGRRELVRVTVDSDHGVDLDAIAEVSHVVSAALDGLSGPNGQDAFAGPYVLEVSSPGVDRPLTLPKHWRRARGRLVEVSAAGHQVRGRVRSVGESGVTLESDGAERAYGWDELGPARVEVEFNRAGQEDEQ